MRAELPPQLSLVSAEGQTVSMASSWFSVWLIVASSLGSEGSEGQVYNVGDEAEVSCHQVHPGSLSRFKFYKAGIPTKIYW